MISTKPTKKTAPRFSLRTLSTSEQLVEVPEDRILSTKSHVLTRSLEPVTPIYVLQITDRSVLAENASVEELYGLCIDVDVHGYRRVTSTTLSKALQAKIHIPPFSEKLHPRLLSALIRRRRNFGYCLEVQVTSRIRESLPDLILGDLNAFFSRHLRLTGHLVFRRTPVVVLTEQQEKKHKNGRQQQVRRALTLFELVTYIHNSTRLPVIVETAHAYKSIAFIGREKKKETVASINKKLDGTGLQLHFENRTLPQIELKYISVE